MAIPEIERNLPLVVPAKSTGLPRACGPRNDVFSFGAVSSCVPAQGRPQADLLELCFVPLALSFKPGISPGGLNPAGEKEGPMGLSAFRLMMHHGIAHKRSLLFMVGM